MKANLWKTSLLCSALLAQPATAEQISIDQFYIAPSLGYYLFDSDRDLDETTFASIAAGMEIDHRWSIEAVYTQFDTDHKYNSALKDYDFEQYHLDGLYHFTPSAQGLQPYLVAGAGNSSLEFMNNTSDETLINAGAGIKYHMTPNWKFRSDLRAYYSLDNELTDIAAVVTLAYQFGKGSMHLLDSDSDGVSDRDDQCPNTPPGVSVDQHGCSNDDDRDGVINSKDQCPDTPPNTAVDNVGCPLDQDGDGVADYLDQCPDTPPHTKVDATGCPLDKDGDGVADYLDQCPDTSAGAKVDDKGCYIVLTEKVSVQLNVTFASNSAETQEEHIAEVEKVAAFMLEYPLTKVTIEGHSDSSGSASYNKTLSQRRANSIAQLLIGKFGIDAHRVSAIGYGEERPIASNDSAAGRLKNRRVVAVVEAEVSRNVR
jgi:OOP family OmpA-OmpF porin